MSEATHVAILGAGLAGSLAAVLLGQQGYNVDVYEKRMDSRSEQFVWDGRSINLALSSRGRKALRKAGVEERVVSQCIPMKGRMMHDREGKLSFMSYGKEGQYILSCGRQMLNEELIQAAEKMDNVKFHFETTCRKINIRDTSFTTYQGPDKIKEVKKAEVIIGADGAFSQVRSALEHVHRVNYSQDYLPHGYKELTIPPTADGEFAMYENALHIWPRGDFMMIALPNPDKTFTVTLFMPWGGETGFDNIKTEEQLLKFFNETFPDSIPLIPKLVEEFFTNPTGYMTTIKCDPWYSNSTVVLGDAAHAVVPFYGQGMNCSLEDVDVLDDLLAAKPLGTPVKDVFPEFFKLRKPAADAIAKLSHDNYIEMRSHVASKLFLFRTKFERVLYTLFPKFFVPHYPMVAFTTIPYHHVVERTRKQTKILDWILIGVPVGVMVGLFLWIRPRPPRDAAEAAEHIRALLYGK